MKVLLVLKPNKNSVKDRFHNNWIYDLEGSEFISIRYCQLSGSCMNWKYFPQEKTPRDSRTVTTKTEKSLSVAFLSDNINCTVS